MASGSVNQDGVAITGAGGGFYGLLCGGRPEGLFQRSPGGGGVGVDKQEHHRRTDFVLDLLRSLVHAHEARL